MWSSSGEYEVQLKLTDDYGCTASESNTIGVEKPLDIPDISCNATTSEIIFSWNDIPEADDIEVTLINGAAGIESPFMYAVSNLMAGGDSVTIQVSAVGPPPCGNSVSTKTCYTDACPPLSVNILPVEDICLYPGTQQVELQGTLDNFDLPGEWSGNGIIDQENGIFDPNHVDVTNGENILYITFTDDNCLYKDSIAVNVYEIPAIDAGLPAEINCSNSEVELVSNGNSNLDYSWNGPSVINGIDSSVAVVDYPGTYFLTVFDPLSNCYNSDSTIVSVDSEVPVANAGEDKAITCAESSKILEGTGSLGMNYQYIWHGPGITPENVNDQYPEVKIPGHYILQVLETTNNCYSPKDSVFVEDRTEPPYTQITQQIDHINCEIISNELIGNTVTSGTYTWLDESFQQISSNHLLSAPQEGIYYYELIDLETGCTGLDSIVVAENLPYPQAIVNITNAIDCDTKEVVLDGSQSSEGQGIIYSWDGNSMGFLTSQNQASTIVNKAGNYILTVSDTLNDCSAESSNFVMEIFNEPTAIIEEPDQIDCNILKTELDGSASFGSEPLNFQWIFDRNTISQNATFTAEDAGSYALIVSNQHSNCHDTALVDLVFNHPPIESVGTEITSPSCFGEKDGIIIFDSIIGGSPSYVFSIDGGQNFTNYNQFYNIEAGTINFVIKDENGCSWDTSLNIVQPEILDLDIGDDMVLQMGDTLNLQANFNIDNSLVDTIIWYPADILSCVSENDCSEVSGRPLNSFYARATLIDLNGCIVQDKIKIEIDKEQIAYVPNIFSPNGDNRNDKFTIYSGNSVKEIIQFSVYSRWGKTIYSGNNIAPNDPNFGWDGTLNGKPLNPDVFVYWAEVELIDGQKTIFKGEVTLIK